MSDISNRSIATLLRHMAWDRAKGELRPMLHSFWPEYDTSGNQLDSGYDQMKKDIEKFIKDFEEIIYDARIVHTPRYPTPAMNLYKISQTSNSNYDAYDAAIVCAETEAAARAIIPSDAPEDAPTAWPGNRYRWCQTIDQVTVELIGTATPGTPEGVVLASFKRIYQKFLAVLQAMGWEPPTPTGISADQIQPGPDWYEVIDAAGHKTLEVGNSVQMVEAPVGAWNLLYRSDGTLHRPLDNEDNYVTLISKPLPTLDAPAPTPGTCYKIEARLFSGRGWCSPHNVGDLRFTTKAEAEGLCAQEYPHLWNQKALRVVIAND
jgi:hypothetical protein